MFCSMKSLYLSLIPLVFLCAMMALVISLFGDDALSGAAQIVLLTSAALAVAIAIATAKGKRKREKGEGNGKIENGELKIENGFKFQAFEDAVTEKIGSVAIALVILLLIGALAGSWMVSGIIPTLIYYGMQILSPSWFLVAACIVCAVVSIMTGSSWTTIATIGVALMGIGQALGLSPGWVGGAIVAGAYFGDKMSPLSDTTVMASSTCGVKLFAHIRFMMGTTVPTLAITLLVFLVVGWIVGAEGESDVSHIAQGLQSTFVISPWLLIVPLITGVMIARRLPTLAILFCAVLMGSATAVLVQPTLLHQISGDESTRGLIRGLLTMLYGDTHLETGIPMLNDLVSTSGMMGMTATIWLIICAMIFGAAMTSTGMLLCIVEKLLSWPSRPISLVATTAISGILMNAILCDQYLSIIITSSMYKDAYRRLGLDTRLLSRTIEDSATVTSPLFPWSSCGMTQAHVLGISTLTYAPYALFNYLSPIMTVLMAGAKNLRKEKR